jgi:hypothetical protein
VPFSAVGVACHSLLARIKDSERHISQNVPEAQALIAVVHKATSHQAV